MNKQRQSNIEVLRIIIMLGVIVLHYNGGVGKALDYAEGINFFVLVVIESVFICAVNLFMLISGYYYCHNKRTTSQKPMMLLLQVILLSGMIYIVSSVISGTFSWKSFFGSMIPANYFVILYIVVYMLSPYLNLLYEYMSTKCMVLLLFLFSIYPTLVDLFNQITGKDWLGLSSISLEGSQAGYTIVNFVLLYLVGMYIRKESESLKKIKNSWLFFTLFVVVTLIVTWSMLSFKTNTSNLAWSYCNPLVIMEAMIIFALFSRITIGNIRWINSLASACFTTYLVHAYLLTFVNTEWAVKQPWIIMITHILITSVSIYIICYSIHIILHAIWMCISKMFYVKEFVVTDLTRNKNGRR